MHLTEVPTLYSAIEQRSPKLFGLRGQNHYIMAMPGSDASNIELCFG